MEELLESKGVITDLNLDCSNVLKDSAFNVPYGPGGTGSDYKTSPKDSIEAPVMTFGGMESGRSYCVIMTDPDAPSRAEPTYREFIHWVVSDAFGAEPKTVVDYVGPGPPCNSGVHRYVFLCYEQPGDADVKSLATAFEGRGGKKADAAAKAAGLGPLKAVAYWEAEWDESVDALHEKIGFLPPPGLRSPKQLAANPE